MLTATPPLTEMLFYHHGKAEDTGSEMNYLPPSYLWDSCCKVGS